MTLTGPTLVRWRAVDPAEHADGIGSTAWTKVHISPNGYLGLNPRTLCGLRIPAVPYDSDTDDQVPLDAPRCKGCARLARV